MDNNNIKVLLVEDETTLAMIVKDTLDSEGFEVSTAFDGVQGLESMTHFHPDVIVADIMMPNMDGFEMVRRLRLNGISTPVLFLTARSSTNDVVEGFELGGDDYLRKPFSMKELIVRIRALVRRIERDTKAQTENPITKIGRFNHNSVTQRLSLGANDGVELSNRESELLKLLAANRNAVVETTDILNKLWGNDSPYNARSLQVFITKLRHHLEDDEDVKIINVRGIGYKLIF